MKKYNLNLTLAEKEDLEVIMDMYNDLIDSYEDGINYPDWQKGVYPNLNYLKNAIERGELYKGEIDNEIVAALVLNNTANEDYKNVPWTIKEPDEEIYIVHTFLVKRTSQGNGIGRQVVEEIINLARKNDIKAIHLDTIYFNTPAKDFYSKTGFTYLGEFKINYEDTDETRFHLFEYNL